MAEVSDSSSGATGVKAWMAGAIVLGGVLAYGMAWAHRGYCQCVAPSLSASWDTHFCAAAARSIWTALSGLAVAPALVLTWYWRTTHRKQELQTALESQVTGRYVAAVGLLTDSKAEKGTARLAGIPALERIAIDSPRDLETVVDTLASALHEAEFDADVVDYCEDAPHLYNGLGRFIETAKLALGRIGHANMKRRGKLLAQARLQYASLDREILTKADFSQANLTGALLLGSALTDADLCAADLTDADLTAANLSGAILTGTILKRAKLEGANLEGAYAYKKGVTEKRLDDRGELELSDENIEKLKKGFQDQIDSAYGNEETILPEGISMPDAWKSTP